MIDINKKVRVLRGSRKGEEGTIIRHEHNSRTIAGKSFPIEIWFVLFSDGKVETPKEEDLEEIADEA